MTADILFQAVVYMLAALVMVPIAKKLGLSSVLGYLLAGILIGPFVLGFIGKEGEDIMHFAEFGVVMMLFLIGLELDPTKFWRMRKLIAGMGLTQLIATAAVLGGAALLLGLDWRASVAIGLALALSSTAIVLQSLKEKGHMQSSQGQASFAVLLFQDIAVIPILAILPLMATAQVTASEDGHHSVMEDLTGWMQTLLVLGAVAAIVLTGRFLVVPLLRQIAKTRLRELFTASALLIVVAITWLMDMVGLSPALGTFLGGVVLANSEFRHELESDLEPFKGLLLGLFFMAVGASIDFDMILSNPVRIVAIVLAVMLIKSLILAITGRVFQLKKDQNLLFSIGLSQVGEFAFVLTAFMSQLGIIDVAQSGMLMAVTAMSMTLTPIFSLVNDRFVLPHVGIKEEETREADAIHEHNEIILVGFSHFGSTIGRFLRANGVNATILDNDSDRVDLLRKMGFKVYYGDATRLDLLKSAGADDARYLVSAIDSPETNLELVETVKKNFPHLQLIIRAKNRFDAYELLDLDVKHIYRESLDTAVRMGVDILKMLGHRTYSAYRSGQNFIKYDEAAMVKLAGERHDKKQYILSVRQQIEEQEELLTQDQTFDPTSTDHAWDSEHMRTESTKSMG
jgi:CPA2 family monovalent cation:H+ antiporter-2